MVYLEIHQNITIRVILLVQNIISDMIFRRRKNLWGNVLLTAPKGKFLQISLVNHLLSMKVQYFWSKLLTCEKLLIKTKINKRD